VAGRLQNIAAAIAAVSGIAWGTCFAGAEPSSTVPLAGGWTARFFVSPTNRPSGLPDEAVLRRNLSLGVNAQFSRRIARNTRLSVDVLNAFDRDAPASGLVPPADGRGIQLGIRATFK
jgi:outer membrane receptor protein involved in Fe transport